MDDDGAMISADEFFKEDEPVEKVREAFARGEKGVTARRPRADVATTAKRMMDAVIERTEKEPERTVRFDACYLHLEAPQRVSVGS
jgi:hypothetical protein